MKRLAFYCVYPIIWFLSLLPLRVLYIISDFLFLVNYYLIGYRKKVVKENLELAFPNKTEKEILAIRKKFFRHFTDLMVESIRFYSISEKEMKKRYKCINPEVLSDLTKKGESIILTGSHQGNWEWSCALPLFFETPIFGTYKELQNKYFDAFVLESRTRFDIKAVETAQTIKNLKHNVDNNIQGIYILLSDQSPQMHKTFHWSNHMGVKVPFHTGAEMISKKFNMPVVNFAPKKVKRGYYEIYFEVLTETPNEFKNFDITDMYAEVTNKYIEEQPAFYLWSHKRFKHRGKYNEWLNYRRNKKK